MENKTRDSFGSTFGTIAALAGSAVGLGNIWKFPYEAGNNGGGAFLLVYIFFTVAIGLPVMLSEFALGRKAQQNAFGTFKVLAPNTKWHYFGILAIAAAVLILSFYGTVSGWTLEYVWLSLSNSFEGKSAENITDTFNSFISHPYKAVLWQLGFMFMSGAIILAGVKKGIERYTKMMMPILLVIIVILGIRACTLEGAGAGLKFLFYPKFSELTGDGILSALGQAFFSLSIGMGVLLTYGSYIQKNASLTTISLQVITTDTLVAVLAGVAILPAVFAFGINPQSGPGLVFLTLPKVFESMAFGQIWSILFFVLLTFAALTSAISLLEVIVAFLVEEKKMSRLKATIITTGSISILGIFCTLSFGPLRHIELFGLTIFDTFDFVSSNILLPVGGILLCIFAGWKMEQSIIYNEISNNGTIKLRLFQLYIFILKYVAPICILLILLNVLGIIK